MRAKVGIFLSAFRNHWGDNVGRDSASGGDEGGGGGEGGGVATLPVTPRAGNLRALVPQPCTNVPTSPPGVSATANLMLVNQSTQGMSPSTKLSYFYMVFRTGGPFDYKTTYGGAGWGDPNQYVAYGNWNFGYVCGADYPSLFCQSMAGTNRMWRSAMQGRDPFGSGLPFVQAPYGDQAADNRQILNGIQAQASGCVQ